MRLVPGAHWKSATAVAERPGYAEIKRARRRSAGGACSGLRLVPRANRLLLRQAPGAPSACGGLDGSGTSGRGTPRRTPDSLVSYDLLTGRSLPAHYVLQLEPRVLGDHAEAKWKRFQASGQYIPINIACQSNRTDVLKAQRATKLLHWETAPHP